jgi:hypothetical protein
VEGHPELTSSREPGKCLDSESTEYLEKGTGPEKEDLAFIEEEMKRTSVLFTTTSGFCAVSIWATTA